MKVIIIGIFRDQMIKLRRGRDNFRSKLGFHALAAFQIRQHLCISEGREIT
jgi:hypothetical protein